MLGDTTDPRQLEAREIDLPRSSGEVAAVEPSQADSESTLFKDSVEGRGGLSVLAKEGVWVRFSRGTMVPSFQVAERLKSPLELLSEAMSTAAGGKCQGARSENQSIAYVR